MYSIEGVNVVIIVIIVIHLSSRDKYTMEVKKQKLQ